MEKTCTVPGWFIQPLDAEPEMSITRSPFYLMRSSVLVAITATLFKKIQPDVKKLSVFKHMREFPYSNATLEILDAARNGTDICPRCSPEVPLDRKLAQCILAHIGAHVLYDKTIQHKEEPCGLCLQAALLCKIYLTKGKGANSTLKIDKPRSSGCTNLISFTYAVAAQSKPSSPCSNVPLPCPLCPKTAPSIWRYNWKAHFENTHPHATYLLYAAEGELSKFEWSQMKQWWRDRQKVPTKRVMRTGLPVLQVSTAHSSGAALGITGLTDDTGNDIIREEEQDFNDDDHSQWGSEREVSDEEEEDFTSESEPEVEEEMERGELHRPPADANFGTENDIRSSSERASMEVQSDEGSLDAPICREIDSIDGTAHGEADA
ncbi:hypothetical protein DXG01_003230 [Tephrocybe rancida]|nr:hypothetical protein DXG01_003230 [Tephrocybe rancida]